MIELEWWSSDDVAAYLRCEAEHVNRCIKVHPEFPSAYTMPMVHRGGNPGRTRPLWKAAEVKAWAESHAVPVDPARIPPTARRAA